MYIPAGLLIVLVLWMLTTNDTRPLPGWLCALGLVAGAFYAPDVALFVLAGAVVSAIPLLLVWGFVGLARLANALPDWRIFRLPQPDGLLSTISFQGWVAISMATCVVLTLLAHTLLPR